MLILFICSCKNNYTEYFDKETYFDYLNNYKEIDSLSKKNSKKIFDSFNLNHKIKSYKLKNDKTIYYVENEMKLKDFDRLCYNSYCENDDNCNIAAVSSDNKYCFYLNKEPYLDIKPNVDIELKWKTMNLKENTAGQF